VAAAERLDIEEGKDLLTLEKLEGRDITCSDWMLAACCIANESDTAIGEEDWDFADFVGWELTYP
jgi:hypothetical protein